MDLIQTLDLALVLRVTAAALGGLAVGFFGGMMGLGLGRLRLPLVYWVAANPINAPGTNNLIGALSNAPGTAIHLRDHRVDFRVLALMGVPSTAGAFLGGYFGSLVPRAALLIVVALTSIWYGYTLFVGAGGKRRALETSPDPSEITREPLGAEASPAPARRSGVGRIPVRRSLLEVGLGTGIGALGGAVGLGLGQFRLPAMIQALDMDPRVAAGTNVTMGFVTSLSGFLGRALHLEVDWAVFVVLGPMSMLGSYLGARQTGKISPRTLTRWMGATMVITSLPLFWLAYMQLS